MARQFIVDLIEVRFPTLTELAQQQVDQITNVEVLRQLLRQIGTAPDEATARWVLSTYDAA